MKSLTEQLSTYKSVHLNQRNIYTHFIGIPLIIWSIALALSVIGFTVEFWDQSYRINLTTAITVLVLGYYLLLSLKLAIFAVVIFGPIIYSAFMLSEHTLLWYFVGGAFVVGWIFQFIGHGFEKAKPAFVDDLNQLLIGPLFLLAEIMFYLGMSPELAKQVELLANEKRKQFEQAKKPS